MLVSRLVSICGNIASGKTTLAGHLAELSFYPVLERFQHNPFLASFYENPSGYCFETEIVFALLHYHDLKRAQKMHTQALVSDYSLILDRAYADVTLEGDRLHLFESLVSNLELEIGLPKLIIHLACPEDVLLQRIRNRNREIELSISKDYLESLTRALCKRLESIASCVKIITINSHVIDFREKIADQALLRDIFNAVSDISPAKF